MADYDSPWKEALSEYFEPFLALFFPDIHADIDWRRGYQTLDQELRQIRPKGKLGPRRVDHLVKVWLPGGREQYILIHVEVQMSVESGFARRMYIYNYRLFDRHDKLAVSLAVLGDGNPRWRPDGFGCRQWGIRAGLWFRAVKLLDYADRRQALEQSGNPFAAVLLAHLSTLETRQDADARYAAKVRLIKGLYGRGWAADDVRRLFRVIDWMMNLPEPLEIDFWQQIKEYEEEKHMPFMTTPERLGREEGLTQGRLEGRLEGLEVALKLKFGEVGLQLLPELRQIADDAKLEAVLRAVPTAASPEALRRLWAE